MVRLGKEKCLKTNKRLNEKTKKSPLTNNPLRIPGQSLDEKIQETIDKGVKVIRSLSNDDDCRNYF